MHVVKGKPSQYTPKEESAFETSDNLFRGCLISILADNLVDTYIRLTTGKQMWDALEAHVDTNLRQTHLNALERV